MTSVLPREDNGRLLDVVRRAAMSPLRSRVDPRSWWPGMGHHISRRAHLVAPSQRAAAWMAPLRRSMDLFPRRSGPHGRGNGVLKAGGEVLPWGARWCGLLGDVAMWSL
jgi:hypothetical protein